MNSERHDDMPAGEQISGGKNAEHHLPLAQVKTRSQFWASLFRGTRMWIATAVCAVIALVLVVSAFQGGGRLIEIQFDDGYGVKPGDTLRYRGIDVGEVTDVSVSSDLGGVTVRVRLEPNAADLARRDSRFWIERPQVGLSRISGLETVVGAKFIGVIPGPAGGPLLSKFKGINSPPVLRGGSSTEITIRFVDGHGIKTGDVVKHLGIVVGEVTFVELVPSLDSVLVRARLADWAAGLARAGSQFWIERPRLGLSEVRGLETLVRGQHLAVLPGPSDGQPVNEFRGLETAPPALRSDEGLEITLTSDQKNALDVGVPVSYRGVQVGHVASVGLASDASTVQARAYIEPEFRSLVRSNTRFWSNVGINADFSVRGFSLKTDSLQSLAIGSIRFATPDQPGRRARTGDRFECASTHEEAWLAWRPQIAVGIEMLPSGADRPEPLRSVIRWSQKRLGFTRQYQRQGWLVLLDNQQLIGLRKFLNPDDAALANTTVLEMAGLEFPFDASRARTGPTIGLYQFDPQLDADLKRWPVSKIREPVSPEDCLVVTDAQSPAIPVAANHVSQDENPSQWRIDASISLGTWLDGAVVLSRVDGSIIGFLFFEKGQAMIAAAELPDSDQ